MQGERIADTDFIEDETHQATVTMIYLVVERNLHGSDKKFTQKWRDGKDAIGFRQMRCNGRLNEDGSYFYFAAHGDFMVEIGD